MRDSSFCNITSDDSFGKQAIPTILVDPREAARLLSISPRKLWALTFEEKPGIPYVRCGRLVRYLVSDLRTAAESRRQGGAE